MTNNLILLKSQNVRPSKLHNPSVKKMFSGNRAMNKKSHKSKKWN